MRKDLKQISKYLSLVLRHKPEMIGLNIDNNGWVNVDELINKSTLEFNLDELKEIVETNDKQRFLFSDDFSKIKATQGHSIKIELELTPIEPPEILYHGTVEKFIDSINKDGLLKMNRNHVHLSDNKYTAINVAKRRGQPIILIIKSKEMFNDGYKFFCSENNVWLTDNVPSKYITINNERYK